MGTVINRSAAFAGAVVVILVMVAAMLASSAPTAAQTVCSVGMRIGPGERCTYPGSDQDFWVDSSGTGRFIYNTSGTGIYLNGGTINGVTYYFRATKQSDGDWLIEMAGSGTPSTTTTTRPTTTTTKRRATFPTRPSDASGRFTSVSAGNNHACAISTNDTITCWGFDLYGQVSDVPSGSFTSVSAGESFTCAISTQDTITCWGSDNYVSDPPSGSFTSVSAADSYACAISTQDTIICWGHRNHLGPILNAPSGFTSVSAGEYHACAISTQDTITCWGSDLWNGLQEKVSGAPSGSFASVSAGDDHSCAISTQDTITCWGSDQVSDAPSGSFTSVSAGDDHSCAISTQDTITCWGSDLRGQVSDAPSGSFTSVSAGDEFTCAISTQDTITCWGRDSFDQISGAPSSPSSTTSTSTTSTSTTSTTRPVVSGVGGPSADELCDPLDGVQFSDVEEGSYGAGYIHCARVLGLSRGTGQGRFSPDAELTRGQAASFLVRLWRDILGRVCPVGGHPFSDADGVHEADIACLFALGITKGTTRTTFGPHHALTMSQVSRFVVRMLNLETPRTCITSGNELEAAAGCLVRFNIAPDTAEAKSNRTVSRAQMAVYLIGLWHNVVGQGIPPAPPLRPSDGAAPPVRATTTTTTRPRPTTTTTTPGPIGDAVTGTITECSGDERGAGLYTVTIAGSVTAHRAVSSLRLTGTVGGVHVGTDFIGSMRAGESRSFTITGLLSNPSGRCGVDMEWSNSTTTVPTTVPRTTTTTSAPSDQYRVGDDLPGFPSGFAVPNEVSKASFQYSGGQIVITIQNGGYVRYGSTTYTCLSSGGCGIEGGRVTNGTIRVS